MNRRVLSPLIQAAKNGTKSTQSKIKGFSVLSAKESNLKIGLIGLGNMGGSMAINLTKEFKNCNFYDINPDNYSKISTKFHHDAKLVSSIKDLNESDIIITMLPNTEHVVSTLTSDDGIFKNCKSNTLIIDCSTIDPNVSRDLGMKAEEYKMSMLDAPVSGGVTGAAAGTLTFMVGGAEYDIERARHVFDAMGKNIVHCGPNGNGEVAKLCNNLALSIEMIGVSEALALGKAHGMDPKLLSNIMNTSTARCWSSDTYNPCPGVLDNIPSSNDYNGGFGVSLMAKDLNLAMNSNIHDSLKLKAGGLASEMYHDLESNGYGGKDFSVIYQQIIKNL